LIEAGEKTAKKIHDKSSEGIRTRRKIPQYSKAINDEPVTSIIIQGKIGSLFSKVWKKTMVPTLPMLIQYSARMLSKSSMARERSKRDTNRKGRSQGISICK
jgi:hypothetical protein